MRKAALPQQVPQDEIAGRLAAKCREILVGNVEPIDTPRITRAWREDSQHNSPTSRKSDSRMPGWHSSQSEMGGKSDGIDLLKPNHFQGFLWPLSL